VSISTNDLTSDGNEFMKKYYDSYMTKKYNNKNKSDISYENEKLLNEFLKEFKSNKIVTKESVDNLKLRCYESCEAGLITKEERDTYLDYLNLDNYTEGFLNKDKVLTKEQCDKIMEKYRHQCASKIDSLKKVKEVKESDYKGFSIDISFEEFNSVNEASEFCKKHIIPILNDIRDKFTKKYKSKFYWNDKVFTEDGLLVVLDSDIYYDFK
jgi:hypothetical protein